jgi:hypothetical protein
VVEEREHEVVSVLVLVSILEREDLEHRVREHVRHSHGDSGPASTVQPLPLDLAVDEVVSHKMRAADVERTKAGPRELALRPEDAARLNLVRLAEELHEDGDPLDVAGPPEAWLPLFEVRLLQVVLQGPIRLGRLVAEGQADDQVDIGGPDVGSRPLRQLPDEVPRGEAAGEIDALAPGTEITKQRDEGTFAACRGLFVVIGVVLSTAQNPITSSRRWSACSRPRRGSPRRSA